MTEVVKNDGTRELFNVHKLADSLVRSGANVKVAEDLAGRIGAKVVDGTSTNEIYQNAYKILHKEERVMAARYSMRRAIFDLGPTGFPFEDYVSELMRAKGYSVKTRQTIKGRCIEHELDLWMQKDGKTIGAELKFHNQLGFKTDVKVALYVRARFWDIEWGAQDRKEEAPMHEGWLITNTKFTEHAIRYSKCAGVHLLGWDYPDRGNLADIIHETRVYPVTIMTTLNKAEKARLLAAEMPLCSSVATNPDALRHAGVPEHKINSVIEESHQICSV